MTARNARLWISVAGAVVLTAVVFMSGRREDARLLIERNASAGGQATTIHLTGLEPSGRLRMLIDAGIPLKYEFTITDEDGVSARISRTLQIDTWRGVYAVSDSVRPDGWLPVVDEISYFQTLVGALHAFSSCTLRISGGRETTLSASAKLVPVYADRLGKKVNMAEEVGLPRKVMALGAFASEHAPMSLTRVIRPVDNQWLRKGRDLDS